MVFTSQEVLFKKMQVHYDAITALTDEYCKSFLNEDFLECARKITLKLCNTKTSPLLSGQFTEWACAILYVTGSILDLNSEIFFNAVDLCATFGVSVSKTSIKVSEISQIIK